MTVEAVADGHQAWKILEDLTANIDLVLTEVSLPSLTGIGLLSKIMSHKTRKNIPVISEYTYILLIYIIKCYSINLIIYTLLNLTSFMCSDVIS